MKGYKMKLCVKGMVVAGILLITCYFLYAAQKVPNGQFFSLSLQPVESHIQKSRTPQFKLTLTNISNRTTKILNADRRVDLAQTYYKVVITRDGRPVDVPMAISDPGPISESDWIKIPPGGVKTFVLSKFPEQYENLSPGVYKAFVRFWRDPYQSHLTAYQSSFAEFVVTK